MFRKLIEHEKKGKAIRVGMVGAGAMGKGIAHQLSITPGMRLSWVADTHREVAEEVAALTAEACASQDVLTSLKNDPVDVFVESTNSIWDAYKYCEAALKSGAHVVLMNAEVDLAFGPELKKLADSLGLIVTSDAGDQHGVISTMIDEIQLWGFKIVQAGNIKGFHNRYATIESLLEEAAKRNLNPVQCCAYTDGTKLNIEMALLANAYGFLPGKRGMRGPRLDRVEQVMEAFDFTDHQDSGEVDYILGAEPGGGVYVVGRCDHPVQMPYLKYYKLGDGPFYLFFRPYHLCHLETPVAIAKAYLDREAVLQPWAGRVADVYAIAKSNLSAGSVIKHGIGDDLVYGEIATTEEAELNNWIPISMLAGPGAATLTSEIEKDTLLTWDDLEFTDRSMVDFFRNK